MSHPPHSPRALITGSTSGIGKATAIAFAKAGYSLILVGRSPEKLAQTAAEILALGVPVETVILDLLRLETIQPELAQVLKTGPLDVLVNNAGMGYTGALVDMPLADWQRVFDLNLTSVFQCIQAVLPKMRQQQRGMIINVSSIAAKTAFPQWGAYCASKAALEMLTKAVAAEERANGIRVSIVAPGAVNTEIWDTETVQADFDRTKMLKPEIIANAILAVAQMPEGSVTEEMTILPSGGFF